MSNFIDVEKIKGDFPIFKHNPDLVYLDSAASSQTPQPVLDAIHDYYAKYRSNVHRSLYKIGEEATLSYEGARDVIANFIGASLEEVIFTPSATFASNMLMYALEEHLELGKDDAIVTTHMEHHSSLVPLQELARRTGASLRHIPITDDFELNYEIADELIDKNTKLVVASLASNVLGTVNDAKRLAEMAHKHGALLVLDVTKAVGHMDLDVGELDADFLYFSGHKMCGPTGIGILYGKKEHLEHMPPGIFGGGIVIDVEPDSAEWRETPGRFEAGTPNIAGAIGLGAAVRYLEGVGIEAIHDHVEELTSYALEELKKIPGVNILSHLDPKKNIGIIAFTIDGIHPHDITQIMSDINIALRSGHHCAQVLLKELKVGSAARASFYLYNTKEDIGALIGGIIRAKKVFNR